MKCRFCKKKFGIIWCKLCENLSCSACIQPEIHNCKNIDKKIVEEIKILTRDLEKIETPKFHRI